jgi:hypothetical protein
MEAVPVFFRVTVFAALVVLTTTLPKLSVVAEIVVCAAAKTVENRQNIAVSDNRTALLNFRIRFTP